MTNDDEAHLSNGSFQSIGSGDRDQESGAEVMMVLTTDPDKVPNPEKLMKKKERLINYLKDFDFPQNLFNDEIQGIFSVVIYQPPPPNKYHFFVAQYM